MHMLLKDLHLLKTTNIFDVQCMTFWYKFSNNTLPNYFLSMFQYNSSLYHIDTRNHDRIHVFPTQTFGARNVLQHCQELAYQFPTDTTGKAQTNSIIAFLSHIKHQIQESYSYDCNESNCYVYATRQHHDLTQDFLYILAPVKLTGILWIYQ